MLDYLLNNFRQFINAYDGNVGSADLVARTSYVFFSLIVVLKINKQFTVMSENSSLPEQPLPVTIQ